MLCDLGCLICQICRDRDRDIREPHRDFEPADDGRPLIKYPETVQNGDRGKNADDDGKESFGRKSGNHKKLKYNIRPYILSILLYHSFKKTAPCNAGGNELHAAPRHIVDPEYLRRTRDGKPHAALHGGCGKRARTAGISAFNSPGVFTSPMCQWESGMADANVLVGIKNTRASPSNTRTWTHIRRWTWGNSKCHFTNPSPVVPRSFVSMRSPRRSAIFDANRMMNAPHSSTTSS